MDKLENRNIVDEMEKSFLEYSMSVIISRALPDLRDGLKPVHRRILYAMNEDGLTPDKMYKKSATTVGNVLGRYHPHGDSSVYESMVRMAQDFSYRYPLVDGHGNFGSIDGDSAAAYRYTEARLQKLSLELLKDINKDTVDYVMNFDNSRKEPVVLPSRYPNILVNGTMGIAVGMATNIPPQNLGEVIDGCVKYIDNNDVIIPELMECIKGPDFPTGASILGNSGIKKAYETGRGSITIRGIAEVVEESTKTKIVITELPYQVNKKSFQERIGQLVRDKIIDGIADLHDESTLKNGIKVVVTLKRDANANVVLNNLYKHTQLQTSFGINLLMLDEGEPKTLNLKEIISKYVDYQRLVIIRRTKFELGKAEDRVHILEGLRIALDNIDEVIRIIRAASNDEEAKNNLMSSFKLSEIQANAILEMRLRRLTGLERAKIEDEIAELMKKIEYLRSLLADDAKILGVIKEELLEIKSKFNDERRTKIDMTAIEYIEDESLIPEENVIIMLTKAGYVKRTNPEAFKTQNRGGVGIKGMSTNDEDIVEHLINLSTHDYLLFFTNKGKVYRLKGYEIPEFSRTSKGIPIINLLQVEKDEKVSSVIQVTREEENKYLLFATKFGIIKKTKIEEFENIRSTGKISINLRPDDELIAVRKSSDNDLILLGSNAGRMVKFIETDLRAMGRTASGVRGINLESAHCVCAEVVSEDDNILLLTEKGYGKKTLVSEFRQTKRGSKGVKALNITEKNGSISTVKVVRDETELVLMTSTGITIKMPLDQVSQLGRVTQGLRLINLKDNQCVSSAVLIKSEPITEEDMDGSMETNNEEVQ
ncbi:MAG: DNA gyrase subunit A [bacterium]